MTSREQLEAAMGGISPSSMKKALLALGDKYPALVLKALRGEDLEAPYEPPPPIKYIPLAELLSDANLLEQCRIAAEGHLREKRIIAAIKAVREISHVGLKEAKDFVETLCVRQKEAKDFVETL